MTDDEGKKLGVQELTDALLALNRENRVLFDLLMKAGIVPNPDLTPIRVV